MLNEPKASASWVKYIRALAVAFLAICITYPVCADIQFEDASFNAGISGGGPSYGASFGDFNGDGRPDIWIGNHPSPPTLYLNLGGVFENIANQVLTSSIRDTHGAAWGDFDDDGDQDLIQVVGKTGSNLLYVNDDGMLSDNANSLNVTFHDARSRSPLWFDWDHDGLLDLVLTRAPSADAFPLIARNTAAGFEDVTTLVGVDVPSSTHGKLSDLNGDKVLDLLIVRPPNLNNIYDISTTPFTEITASLNFPGNPPGSFYSGDEVIADLNGDLRNDIFRPSSTGNHEMVIRNDKQVDLRLKAFKREEGLTFVSTGPITIDLIRLGAFPPAMDIIKIGAGGQSAPTFLFTLDPADPNVWGIAEHIGGVDDGLYAGFDPDTDSWTILLSTAGNWDMNLVVTSVQPMSNVEAVGFNPVPRTARPSLFVNTGTGFEERRSESQLDVPQSCVSAVGGDFDNDKDVDLYLACSWPVSNAPNLLFENLGNAVFTQVASAGGAAGGIEGRSETVIMADYDEDGFLDLFVTNGEGARPFHNGPHQMFRNLGNSNHWLEIDLVGRISNRDAVGATVELTSGGVTQIREQDGGMHRRGQNYQRLHFGLGADTTVDRLEVYWPSGIIQVLTDVQSDQIIQITETATTECGDGQDNDGDSLADYPDDPQCTHWSVALESDQDSDGVGDAVDNCTLKPNGDQRDTDNDGYGNVCDPDFNNNLVVDPFDFSLMKSSFGSTSTPDLDLNGNGVVDPFDFSQLKAFFGKPPGPSSVSP